MVAHVKTSTVHAIRSEGWWGLAVPAHPDTLVRFP